MDMIWPIALVVFSNIIYQICAKGVPKDMDAMASMTITYIVGAVCSAIMYFVMNRNGNLLQEYTKMNWAPIFLGVSVVGRVLYHETIMANKIIGIVICLVGLYFINK